jgi:glycosyltransferase involved in cell wall biosynthesis
MKAIEALLGRTLTRKLLGHYRSELDNVPITVITSAELGFRFFNRSGPLLRRAFAFRFPMTLYGYLSARYVTECDLLHVRSGYGRFAMDRARRQGAICLVDHSIADSDYVYRVYEDEARMWPDADIANTFSPSAWANVNRDLSEADHVLVNSEFVKGTLVAAGRARPEQISVVYLGVDTERFSPGETRSATDNDDPFTILYVGTISYRKGVQYLLAACRRLRLANARVVLVGPAGDFPIRKHRGRFDYVPGVASIELPAWYQRASVFVFPSLAEGSARVNFEAMACGIPVITTEEAGSPVRDGLEGFIVPARDIDALADRIDKLYKDPTLRRNMGAAARARIESQFTWDRYWESVLTLYNRLIVNGRTNSSGTLETFK